jgi:hypothetical protein
MRYIHLFAGKLFWLLRALFSHQLTKTAPCYHWGNHTIVSLEGPSGKSLEGRTIRFWINPNKQHLSFSSLFNTTNPPCETSIGWSFLNKNSPLLYLLPPYLHCSSSTSITTHMNSAWWVCSKRMSLDLLRRLCINSGWSVHTTAQSYVSIPWGKIHSKRDMHLSCNCVQLAWIAHRRNEVTVSSLSMSHIFDA